MVTSTPNGRGAFMTFDADGKVSFSLGDFSDSGQWRVVDNGYCARWTRIRNGEERCFTVVKDGGTYRVFGPDGAPSGTIHRVR